MYAVTKDISELKLPNPKKENVLDKVYRKGYNWVSQNWEFEGVFLIILDHRFGFYMVLEHRNEFTFTKKCLWPKLLTCDPVYALFPHILVQFLDTCIQ